MKTFDFGRMHEATRLTRAGRLNEALALLQTTVMDGAASRRSSPTTIEGEIVSSEEEPTKPAEISPQIFTPLGRVGLPTHRRNGLRISDITPDEGRYVSGTFSSADGTRAYKLYIPSNHETGPRPLIVMLHGCTQSADDFAAGTRMNFVAEVNGCFVLYPEQPQAANVSRCWNWFRPSDQERGRGEPALIAGLTRDVMGAYNIDRTRVYVAGLSAGGAAAAIMGEAYPDLYAAVGVHSGLACGSAHDVTSAFAAMRGEVQKTIGNPSEVVKPTIVFHGDRDATVHPCNGAKVIARVAGNTRLTGQKERKKTPQGFSFSHLVHRDASGAGILELWELHGAGHSWSGGSSMGSFTSEQGPDASKEMLRFFLQHRLTS